MPTLLTSIIAAGVLYFIEQNVGVSYAYKTILKIVVFVIIPLLLIQYGKGTTKIHVLGTIKNLSIRNVAPGLIVGGVSFIAIIAAYFILGRFVDFNAISQELTTKLAITPTNFIFVGLYITLVNSFIEEFFFRGYVFLNLQNKMRAWFAHVFSAALFSAYHMAIFEQWFNPVILALCLVVLFGIALVFTLINKGAQTIINSWIAHMCANAAIILIGMRMFGII